MDDLGGDEVGDVLLSSLPPSVGQVGIVQQGWLFPRVIRASISEGGIVRQQFLGNPSWEPSCRESDEMSLLKRGCLATDLWQPYRRLLW